jgi:tRNA-Thr(GGU) m(6)t(6)A37 methyltransferase TsaA
VAGGDLVLRPIGRVESILVDPADAPKQGDEGAPDAVIVFDRQFGQGLRNLKPGDDVVVLTWLDRAARDVLVVRPRSDPARAEQGVFSTRSPARPNPIGLHRVKILALDGLRMRVGSLEAVDGTPVLDVKPVLRGVDER